ncbi:MAG TPA: hypothetical protein VJB34_08560, partial [Bdellovibrionota bacterium]|nr:hypothetical protein [Bdellovibrionota bacterium]
MKNSVFIILFLGFVGVTHANTTYVGCEVFAPSEDSDSHDAALSCPLNISFPVQPGDKVIEEEQKLSALSEGALREKFFYHMRDQAMADQLKSYLKVDRLLGKTPRDSDGNPLPWTLQEDISKHFPLIPTPEKDKFSITFKTLQNVTRKRNAEYGNLLSQEDFKLQSEEELEDYKTELVETAFHIQELEKQKEKLEEEIAKSKERLLEERNQEASYGLSYYIQMHEKLKIQYFDISSKI